MLKKQIALLLFSFLISYSGYSNFKPSPGYYIDLKGDTVRCNVEFNDRNGSQKTVQVQVNNAMKEFGPDDIKGFGVSGEDDYVSAKVTYHTNPVSGEDLPKNYSDNTVTSSCFLKVLKRNIYSLYSLVLPARGYLFVSYPDKSLVELVYRAKRNNNDSLIEDQSYRNQLLALFANEGLSQEYFGQISEVSYNGSAIGSLVDILNETNTGVKTVKKPGNLQMDVFGGILQNSFPSSFDSHYTKNNQFKSQISPIFGVNFLYRLPGKNLMVGLALGFNEYHTTVSNVGSYEAGTPSYYATNVYTETITAKNSFLISNLYIMYLINPSSRTRFYLKGGINYYFSYAYDKSGVNLRWDRVETGMMNGTIPFRYSYGDSLQLISMKNYFISFKAAAGVNFGRSYLELSYSPPVQIATPTDDIYNSGSQTDFKLSSVGICFYFTLFH